MCSPVSIFLLGLHPLLSKAVEPSPNENKFRKPKSEPWALWPRLDDFFFVGAVKAVRFERFLSYWASVSVWIWRSGRRRCSGTWSLRFSPSSPVLRSHSLLLLLLFLPLPLLFPPNRHPNPNLIHVNY